MPSKKKYNARFPPARIKKIMQTDEDVGKVAAPVPVLISKALEIFLESLITKSSHQTQARSAKTMTTAHIKQCIQSESTFDFLKDLVENVPDIAQGEEEDTENNHTTGMPASNNRHTEGRTAGISRSSSTASSSSLTEAPQKRRRGRPRKHLPEDQAGPSQRKRSQLVAQSSEERTTSEDSDFSDSEITDSRDSLSRSMPAISLSLSKTSQDTRQRQPEVHMPGQATQQQQQKQPAFGIPVMPQFQVPTAPSNVPAASVGMGLYQMPKASSIGNEDEEDDYDT